MIQNPTWGFPNFHHNDAEQCEFHVSSPRIFRVKGQKVNTYVCCHLKARKFKRNKNCFVWLIFPTQ